MRKLYGAFDLHSSNSFLGISDEKDKRIYQKRLPNQPDIILAELEPYRTELVGLVVESTYNWYWLVDLLMGEGFRTHLANPSGIQQYKGLKHSDDRHDAFWLTHLLRLGILPEGYIYPKEERPARDLLRKRGHLVKLRTSLINSLQGIIHRNCGVKLNSNKIKALKVNHVEPMLYGQEDLALSGQVSKDTIDYLGQQVRNIENVVLKKIKLKKQYQYLLTMPGIGKILALTIMLEIGPIERFPNVGNLSSYCRKVSSCWTSNNKKKGKGNKKNGNRYLAWAFSEAAELARRYDEHARAFYNRKASRTNCMVAHSALAHKLTRAAYYVIRDQVAFEPHKLFV